MDWNLLFSSYGAVFGNLQVLFMTLLGAAGGVLIGAIPGMTATMGVALLIPFSFGMDLIPSIGLLLGIYCGGMYGGSISAILIHAPGTPSAAATVLDGYPMAQKGEAGKALSVAMFSSFVGGVIGALIMTFLSPLVAKVAMKFSSAEMLMLADDACAAEADEHLEQARVGQGALAGQVFLVDENVIGEDARVEAEQRADDDLLLGCLVAVAVELVALHGEGEA